MHRCFLFFLLLAFFIISPVHGAAPLKIGISLGITGKYSLTSNKQKNAYAIFQEEINAKGGILGRPVEFVIKDNESKADIAITQYEELITKDKVDFVIGPYTSGLTLAISPVVEKYGFPMLVAGAAADIIWQQGYENVFGMWTPASRYALGFLKMVTYSGNDNVVIVTPDEPFGSGIAKGARKWAAALRLNVLNYITFADGTKDLREVAERVKKSKPDVLICTGHYYVGVSMRRALKEIGWQPRIFFATVSPTFQKYYDDFGDEINLDFSSSIWEPHPKLNYPGSYKFARQYEQRYGDPPTYHAASAYAASEVLAKAINQAGTFDRDAVRTVLQTLNTVTILGRFAVDKKGVQIKRFPLVVQWQEGRKEIVWPLELQTAPFKFRED